MSTSKPPVAGLAVVKRTPQKLLRFNSPQAGRRRVQRHQPATAVRKHEQSAVNLSPQVAGSVLDGRLPNAAARGVVWRRHEGFEHWLAGEQGSRPLQRVLALALEGLESEDGVFQGLADLVSYLPAHPVAHNQ